MPHSLVRGPDGFTLIELMIAVAFLSVGILAMAQVFAVANRHTGSARQETFAVALSEEIREKIMSEAFDQIRPIFNGADTERSPPPSMSPPRIGRNTSTTALGRPGGERSWFTTGAMTPPWGTD